MLTTTQHRHRLTVFLAIILLACAVAVELGDIGNLEHRGLDDKKENDEPVDAEGDIFFCALAAFIYGPPQDDFETGPLLLCVLTLPLCLFLGFWCDVTGV